MEHHQVKPINVLPYSDGCAVRNVYSLGRDAKIAGHRLVENVDGSTPYTRKKILVRQLRSVELFDCYGDRVGEYTDLAAAEVALKKSEARMRQCWSTPGDLFTVLDDEFHFTLDCAANSHNSQCRKYIGEKADALSDGQAWASVNHISLFLNPGFNNPMPWVQKMNAEVERTPGSVGVVIGIAACSTKWWAFCNEHASEIGLLGGKRPQYVPPPGIKKTSNPKDGAVIIFRHGSRRNGGHAKHSTWNWSNAERERNDGSV